MKLGNKIYLFYYFYFFYSNNFIFAEEKITTSPLINIDEIKPSFEELDEENENISSNKKLKEKKILKFKIISSNFNWS